VDHPGKALGVMRPRGGHGGPPLHDAHSGAKLGILVASAVVGAAVLKLTPGCAPGRDLQYFPIPGTGLRPADEGVLPEGVQRVQRAKIQNATAATAQNPAKANPIVGRFDLALVVMCPP